MKKELIACAAIFFLAVQGGAQQSETMTDKPQEEPGQGMMTDGGQMPAMKKLKQLELMMQDTTQVMADIVKMQQTIVEGMNSSGKRDLLAQLTDLSARVNTLAAGMKGMIAQGMTGQGATGGSGAGGPVKRGPGVNAPRIQEKTEAGVSAKVALESSNGIVVFRVALDSETENFDQYRFSESVTLRAAGGREFLARLRSQEGAGNHRSAILEFDNPGTKQFEIVLRNIAGVPERIFPFPF
jgi:hypothetical protein